MLKKDGGNKKKQTWKIKKPTTTLESQKKNELDSSTGLAEKNKSLEQRFDFMESLKLNSIANI